MKCSSQKYDRKTFIMDFGATSHMVNPEEHMENLCDAETHIAIEDSGILTGKKHGDWNE